MDKKALLKYLSALLLFGSNGVVASFIELSSLHIVLLRTLIGSIMLVLLFFITDGKLTFYIYKKQSLSIVMSGFAMGTSWLFLYEAYSRIGVSIASLLYYCGPVIVMALSPLFFKEKLSTNKVIGFITVVAGIILVNGNIFDNKIDIFGIVCGLLSAVMYAFMVICNKKATNIVGLENSTLQLTIAFVTVTVFALFKQECIIKISPANLLPILMLGLANTGIGCYLYFSSIQKLKVQTVAICGYIEPLSAVLFSVAFLKETLLPSQLCGAIFIIGGAMYGELLKSNK